MNSIRVKVIGGQLILSEGPAVCCEWCGTKRLGPDEWIAMCPADVEDIKTVVYEEAIPSLRGIKRIHPAVAETTLPEAGA
jgi:hypothetical protein